MRSFIAAILTSLLLAGIVSAAETPKVRLQTNLGDITLELDPQRAPSTVKNFLGYVESGFYDGTIFHRVIDGFMIQGGGFTEDFERKRTGAPIQNEATNGLKNVTGSIAMARTPNPHSATSQFFINVNDNSSLNYTSATPSGWGYAVFGRVVEGMDVVDKIRRVQTTAVGPYRDVPASPIRIERAVVETAKSSEY